MALIAPQPPRSPWQLLYGAGHRARRRRARERALSLPRPVISVGNLHWGGSGKTPLVAAIARHLRDRGVRVAILARGYGRRGQRLQVVSNGEGPLLGPRTAGDEPVLLAGELRGVAVVVGPDRYEAGRHALERLDLPPQLFLLDDGFSHLGLRRDLDLLAFPAADPFAGGRLLPSGRLREPLASAMHAHAVLLTGALEAGAGSDLAAALRPYAFAGPGFASITEFAAPRDTDGEPLAPGTRVVAVAGIARPESFFAALRRFGLDVADSLAFPDHHPYPDSSLRRIERTVRRRRVEWVVMTAKDRVKLHGRLDLPLSELAVRAVPEAAFWTWLDAKLAPLLAAEYQAGILC